MKPGHVEKMGPLKYYSPSKKNIKGRFCVLRGMEFFLWDSDKAYKQGKKATDEVALCHATQINPIGKKMGKPFCIHLQTNGINEAFWAKDTDDQNAWVDALRAACKKPEPQYVVAPGGNSSKQDVQIHVDVPGGGGGMDPNAAYQMMMQQQQMQLQYQQQLAAYNAQLAAASQFNASQPPSMYPPQTSFNASQPPSLAPQAALFGSSGQLPQLSANQSFGHPHAGYAPAPSQDNYLQMPDSYYSNVSAASSPMPSPQMPRHHSPSPSPPSVSPSGHLDPGHNSPYGRF